MRPVLAFAGGFALVAAHMASAETLKPTMAPRAMLLGSVNFAALAASKANVAAPDAPVNPRARLLPNGTPVAGSRPPAASLLHLAPNVTVAPGKDIASISGFAGIYEGANLEATGSELEPPDQGMAVDHGVVGEIVNNTIQFFKSGQPLTAPLNNATFFNSGSIAELSDPHITYDPSVQRWFADELTYSGPLGFGIYLAVSISDDPTGSWNVYFLPAGNNDLKDCGKAGCLPDFPQVGYDANAFYITADLFGPKRFAGAVLYAVPKAYLVEGHSVTPVRFILPDFVVQPTVPAPGEPFSFANGGTEFLMTARNIYDGSDKIRVWQVQNTFNIITDPSSLVAVHNDFAAEAYTGTVPSTEPDVIGPYGRSQKATSAPLLDGGYNAFTANVKMARGHLFAALTTGAMDRKGLARDNIAYFEVDVKAAKPRLVNQGYIVPPDGYSISYPGLALDRNGNGFVGVTITNPDKKVAGGYPSTAIIPFSAKSGTGAITVTGVGGTSDDGFTGYGAPHSPGQVGRWGDFASAAVDAATGIYYTANEFIPDPAVYPRGVFANWGTYITAIQQ